MGFATLENEQYIRLTTFRKNGEAVSTPVWFALEGDKVYVLSLINAGKHKRLKNTSRVELAASDYAGKEHGERFKGEAILHDAESEMGKYATKALSKKYGFQKWVFDLFQTLMRQKRVYIEISLL